jgi:hypothetical protein
MEAIFPLTPPGNIAGSLGVFPSSGTRPASA